MNILIAALCIVGGAILIWGGVLIGAAGATMLDKNGLGGVLGIVLGVAIALFGVFVKFYLGWWGVIRAVIDYAKQ